MKLHKISIHRNAGFTPLEKSRSERLKPRPRAERSQTGFTIIEIIVVMAILVGFMGMGMMYTMDAYRGNVFRSEFGIVINLLQKARNQSVNNINQIPHGVKFESNEIIIFHGASYVAGDPNNDVFERKGEVSIVTTLPDDLVVFEQLSGSVDPSKIGTTTIQFGTRSTEITINDEGRINW